MCISWICERNTHVCANVLILSVLAASRRTPSKSASRLFLSCYWIITVTVAAAFGGNLMAALAVRRQVLPVSSIAQLAAHPGYEAAIFTGGSTHSFFRVGGNTSKPTKVVRVAACSWRKDRFTH